MVKIEFENDNGAPIQLLKLSKCFLTPYPLTIISNLMKYNFLLSYSIPNPHSCTVWSKSKSKAFSHGLFTHKNIKIPIKKEKGEAPYPPHYALFWANRWGYFKSCPRVPKLGLWGLFEGDSADKCHIQFL